MKIVNRLLICFVFIIAAYFAITTTAGAAGTNWPQWRGPSGQGVSTEKNLPDSWSPTKNIKWKTPIAGRGHSSPIVWGKRIFLTTAIEGEAVPGAKAAKHLLNNQEFKHPDAIGADKKHTFKVICLDSETGKPAPGRGRLTVTAP